MIFGIFWCGSKLFMILDPSWFGYLMHFDAICLSASATLLHTSPSSQFLSVGSIRSRPAGWLDVAGCGWATRGNTSRHRSVSLSEVQQLLFPLLLRLCLKPREFLWNLRHSQIKKNTQTSQTTRNISGITVRIQPKLEKESRHVANTDHSRLKGRASANMSTYLGAGPYWY